MLCLIVFDCFVSSLSVVCSWSFYIWASISLSITQHKLSVAIYQAPQPQKHIANQRYKDILHNSNFTRIEPYPTPHPLRPLLWCIYSWPIMYRKRSTAHCSHAWRTYSQPSSSSTHITFPYPCDQRKIVFKWYISLLCGVVRLWTMGWVACRSLETYQNYCCQRSHSEKLFIEKKMGVWCSRHIICRAPKHYRLWSCLCRSAMTFPFL